jgi:hypothetical protein
VATQTLATADAILKDFYVGPIVEALNYKTYLIDQIERDSDHIDHTGRRAIVPIHSNRNRGRGARGDNSTLPTAGRQAWQDAIINIRYFYYGIEVTDPSITASERNEGAFINTLEAETQGVAKEMRKDINRQSFGTGTGALGALRANSSGTTVNVDTNTVQYIGVGDFIDVLETATGAATLGVVNAEVTARVTTSGAETLTIGTALAGTATTAYSVYFTGNRSNEMDGLRNITDDGRTLHSINSSTAGNEFWNGKERDASTAVAGESLFEQLSDDVGQSGNGEVEVFLTTRGIRRRLADTYQSQKRFNDAQAVNIHGGYSAIMVNEVPVVADDDAPKKFAFGFDKSAFKWFEQTKPGWMEMQGGNVFHLKDGSSAGTKQNVWQAWFRWYCALGCVAPNRTGRIINAEDDAAS